MANLEGLDGKPWRPWWLTLKSSMANLEVHDGIPWSPSWHIMKSLMAYHGDNDGVPWSPWWHTLKSMMAYLEDHVGISWRPWWQKEKNWIYKKFKLRVDFPKYELKRIDKRKSCTPKIRDKTVLDDWAGAVLKKKKFKNAMDRRTNISVVACLQLKRGEWSSRKKLNSRNNSRIPKMSWIKKWDSKKFESNSYKL